MIDMNRRPTVDNVKGLYQYLLEMWGPKFLEDDEYRDLIFQRNNVEIVDIDETKNIRPIVYRSGRADGLLNHARGLIMTFPVFEVEPMGTSFEKRKEAEDTEQFFAKVFMKYVMANDFWADLAKDVLAYGRGFAKSIPLPSVWTTTQGYPVRAKREKAADYLKRVDEWKSKEAEFPFVIQRAPTLNVLALADEDDNLLACIQIKRVMAGLLEEMGSTAAAEFTRGDQGRWWEDMVVLEYSDSNYVAYYVIGTSPDGWRERESLLDIGHSAFEEFRVWQHGMGKCPVVMFPGIKTGEDAPEERYKSFLYDAKPSLEMYDMLLSRMATLTSIYYLPSYIWRLPDSSTVWEGKDQPDLEVAVGGVTPLHADESLELLPYPPQSPDANALLEIVDDIIQRHTLEDVLFGRVQGDAPAFQVNLRIGVAKSKLTPIAEHMAVGAARLMDLFCRGVIALGESVTIDGETLTPSRAKDALGRIGVSIQPKSPVDRSADFGTAKMALEIGLPWEWVVENILDEQNPVSLKTLGFVEELEKQPGVAEVIMKEAVEEFLAEVREKEMERVASEDNSLPAGMQGALAQLESGAGVSPEEALMGELEQSGLGRGPFPPGGAPQTLAPRGLLTENEQPQPSSPGAGTA